MLEKTPSGLNQIITTFGQLDSKFEARNIVTFELPYTLFYDHNPVKKARCHRLLVDNFVAVFTAIKERQLNHLVQNYGGIYNQRPVRGGRKPSTHSWGIAIDLEPAKYPLGSQNRFPDAVVAIFKKYGFIYGGDFKSRKDPMHFQFALNY